MPSAPPNPPGRETGPSLPLTVARAPARDHGYGYARLDPADLQRLGAAVGDVLLVEGPAGTAATKAMPAFAEDRGKRLILLDEGTLADCGAVPEGPVTVTRVPAVGAQRVRVRPAEGSAGGLGPSLLARLCAGLPVRAGMRLRFATASQRQHVLEVLQTVPAGAVVLGPATVFELAGGADGPAGAPAKARWEGIGGLRRELARIRELVEVPLRHPELFAALGVQPPRGLLLYGPPGTGKTLIARAVAHETGAAFFLINGPEIIDKYYGQSEKHLKEIFAKASAQAPAIVFIDELDAIAPKRAGVQGEVEKRVVATLLAQLDGLRERGQVVVIGATNLPDALDPALRRPGRFDREIQIGVPDRHGRLEILQIHCREMPLAPDVDLAALAALTHGYSGADLASLAREAAMACLREALGELPGAPPPDPASLVVQAVHFRQALREIRPSGLREVFADIPNVRWEDVGGLTEAKRVLREVVEWPLRHPEFFRAARLRPPRGLLLEGPPGCGKTLLARAVATEAGANFIVINGPELFSKYVGETEGSLRQIFATARTAAPAVVFIDELDGLVGQRGEGGDGGVGRRVVTQLLTEMDGIEELGGVFVLAATNRRDLLDPALLRTGRFDYCLRVTPPDAAARAEILGVHLRGRPLAAGVDLPALTAAAEGLSGSDLAAVASRAALAAIRRALAEGAAPETLALRPEDFSAALAELRAEARPAALA